VRYFAVLVLIAGGFVAFVLWAPRCHSGEPQTRIGGALVAGCPGALVRPVSASLSSQ
jgi:hypothetical protein